MTFATTAERQAFRERFNSALSKYAFGDSPTEVARNFNARFADDPITMQAARKWMAGEAIPTQAKLRVLADWLSVSPHWLRYGEGQESAKSTELVGEEMTIVHHFRSLDPTNQRIALEIMSTLARASKNTQGATA